MEKNSKLRIFALSVVLGLMLSLPLWCSVVSTQPLTTVKVNGARLLGPAYFPDVVMLEAKAQMYGNELVSGSGSVHGILCHATFFFQLTKAIVGVDSVTMQGTIVATNMATQQGIHDSFWFWVGSTVQVTAKLDGSNMHLCCLIMGSTLAGQGK